ncbi:MAG TPA: type II CAAX endopeptidase family protein [Anaerolineales bacterium]|nr:type II CAAX endopeptidase family protein [Anaerolineales bacterium]
MSLIQPSQDRSLLARIFLSPDEPRLRAGWRLLIQITLYVVFLLVFGTLAAILGRLDPSPALLWNSVINTLAFTASVYVARRWLDRQSFQSLGLSLNRYTLPDILAGVAITLVQIGFIYFAMSALGWLTFQGFAWEFDPIDVIVTGVLQFLVIFILAAWGEEILSRGYHLQTIASGSNLFWGAVISSAIFGMLHLSNPNATWLGAAGIFLAGITFAYAYLRTKQLWLPMGMHLGWNFFLGVVFGFPVSGLDIYNLTRIRVQGPELWTGGEFGPEAGLIIVPSLILAALMIYLYTRRR